MHPGICIYSYRGSCFLNTTTYDSVVKELELALYIVQILSSICSSTCQAADYACIKDQGAWVAKDHISRRFGLRFLGQQNIVFAGPCLIAKAMLNYVKHNCLLGSCVPLQ